MSRRPYAIMNMPLSIKPRPVVKAAVIVGGASQAHKRNAGDYYATPEDCTRALLDSYGSLFEGRDLWEPACGEGAISNVLRGIGNPLLDNRPRVVSTDLEDRGFGTPGVDFLTQTVSRGAIITNPPFSLAAEFIEKAASFDQPFAMLLKATYWHAKKRRDLFDTTGPLAVAPMTWRPAMAPERGKSGTMDFLWTVWGSKPSPSCEYRPLSRPPA